MRAEPGIKLAKPTGDPITPMLLAVGCALLIPSVAGVTLLVSGASLVSTSAVWRTMQSMSLAIFVAMVSTAGLKYAWRTFQLPGRSPSDYLPLRWWLRRRATLRVGEIVDELESHPDAGLEKLAALAKALERRDIYTRAHSGRVSRLTIDILTKLGLTREESELGRIAALLHDVGKIEIPDEILFKPGPLDSVEEKVMRRHPEIGAELAHPYAQDGITEAIRYHHERLDGEGYPFGIRTETLPVIARVIPVCDTYDSLISDRPYRTGIAKIEAFKKLREAAGTQLDAEIVEILIELEQSRMTMPVMVLALPLIPIFKRVMHAFHASTAPTALIAVTVASATVGGLSLLEPPAAAPSPARSQPQAVQPQPPPIATEPEAEIPGIAVAASPFRRARQSIPPRSELEPGNGRDQTSPPPDPPTPPPAAPCAVAGIGVPNLPVLGLGCPVSLLPQIPLPTP